MPSGRSAADATSAPEPAQAASGDPQHTQLDGWPPDQGRSQLHSVASRHPPIDCGPRRLRAVFGFRRWPHSVQVCSAATACKIAEAADFRPAAGHPGRITSARSAASDDPRYAQSASGRAARRSGGEPVEAETTAAATVWHGSSTRDRGSETRATEFSPKPCASERKWKAPRERSPAAPHVDGKSKSSAAFAGAEGWPIGGYPINLRNEFGLDTKPGKTALKLVLPRCRYTTSLSTVRKSVVSARSRPSYRCSVDRPGQRP